MKRFFQFTLLFLLTTNTPAMAEPQSMAEQLSSSFGRALQLLKAGERVLALEQMKGVEPEIEKEIALKHTLQGRIFSKAQLPKEAVIEYTKAVKHGGWMLRSALAEALFEVGNYKRAYEELASYNKSFTEVWTITEMKAVLCKLEGKTPLTSEDKSQIDAMKQKISEGEARISALK